MNKYLTEKITSPFGMRDNPLHGVKPGEPDIKMHRGCDFAPNSYHFVWAGTEGRIRAAMMGAYGEGLFVQIVPMIKGIVFYENLFHNSKTLVKPGFNVKPGDVVAISGNTGDSVGEHIHDEIFTYNLNDPLIETFQKTIGWWIDEPGHRIFFDPIGMYKWIDEHGQFLGG